MELAVPPGFGVSFVVYDRAAPDGTYKATLYGASNAIVPISVAWAYPGIASQPMPGTSGGEMQPSVPMPASTLIGFVRTSDS